MAKNKSNLNRGVSYKSVEVISKLYESYVRPHLEYCIQFWSPKNVKDADLYVRRGTEKSNENDSKFKKLTLSGGQEKNKDRKVPKN